MDDASCCRDRVDGRAEERVGAICAGAQDRGSTGASGQDRSSGRGWPYRPGDCRTAGHGATHGGSLAGAVPQGGRRRAAARCSPAWPHAGHLQADGARGDREDHAAEALSANALVDPHHGSGGWPQRSQRAAYLARVRPEAASHAYVQVEQRSPLRREAGRCRRSLPESARACAGAFPRREEPDSGAGPHPARA